MHTPPKSIHPIMANSHNWEKAKHGGNVYKEIGIQNITRRKIKKTRGIYATRTTGNTNKGGGT